LIPTDGFYEWQAGAASGPKQPYFVRAKRGDSGAPPPLAFAGLWETWTGLNRKLIYLISRLFPTGCGRKS
jgi:putative SOS response-associated peptidase YedK